MVFDWKNNREEALKNGMTEWESGFSIEPMMVAEDGIVSGHTFCNFDTLSFDANLHIENCVFENCRSISIENCVVKNCVFSGASLICLYDVTVFHSRFTDSISDADTLLSLEDTKLHHCTFENIQLLNDSYLCDGVGDSWIDHCAFNQISTNRQDVAIINCEETVGKLFQKTKRYCICDESSCKGLEQIRVLDASDSAEVALPEFLRSAVDRGLLTKEQAKDLKHSQEQPDFDGNLLAKPITGLNLRIPTFNCLTRNGILTVGDLVKLDIVQILQIRHIGKSSVMEVATHLNELGVCGTSWDFFLS